MTSLLRTGSLALVLLASGCVRPRPTDPYAGVIARPAYPESGERAVASDSVPEALTLDASIRVALANNPEVAASEYDTAAAVAQWDLASAQRLPSVRAVAGYTRYNDAQRLLPAAENGEPGAFSRDVVTGDLILSLPLFTGGRISSEIRAAELLRASAERRLARTRHELVFNVTSVFYGILAQRQVIESLEFSRSAMLEHLKRIEALVSVEKAARVDLLRIDVRVADLAQRLARERNVLAVQTRVLANLLGSDIRSGVDPVGRLELASPRTALGGDAWVQALSRRPDYLAARAALEAQANVVDAARSGHWPTVSLQGAYGGRWAVDPTDRPSGIDGADDFGRVGVVVDVPIFDGGRIEARVREQRARLAAAHERLRKLELQVRLDVEAATLAIGAAAERVAATERAIEQAREGLRIERERHDLGKGSITDVLDAQAALLDSQTTYYRALADHSIAIAQLELATGETL